MYKQELPLNNLKGLNCHNIQPNTISIFFFFLALILQTFLPNFTRSCLSINYILLNSNKTFSLFSSRNYYWKLGLVSNGFSLVPSNVNILVCYQLFLLLFLLDVLSTSLLIWSKYIFICLLRFLWCLLPFHF